MLNTRRIGPLMLGVILFVALGASPASGKCTKEQYDRIQTGMSYSEVVAILGSEGEELSRSEVAGFVTVMYMWKCNWLGGNMNVMIQNGRVVSKAQYGLR